MGISSGAISSLKIIKVIYFKEYYTITKSCVSICFLGPFLTLLGISKVPVQTVSIIERKFQYRKTLTEGLHFIIPLLDKVMSNQSLKGQVFIVYQTTFSRDWKPMSVFIYIKLKVFQYVMLYIDT